MPDELTAREGAPVFINQYIVDDAAQTSGAAHPDGFGAYSLTYLGVELAGLDTEDGTPGRWWTHYLDSSPSMISYALARGVPATAGRTELELGGGRLVATTWGEQGQELIRTTVRVEHRHAVPPHRPAALPHARRRRARERALPVRHGRRRDVRGRVGRVPRLLAPGLRAAARPIR